MTPDFICTPGPCQTGICRRLDDARVKSTPAGVIRDQIWRLDHSTFPHTTLVRLIWVAGTRLAPCMLDTKWKFQSMADGLGSMKQYGTFSNTALVLLQRPSDDTRNMQLHRCISMSRADDPSSDLRTNSIIVTSRDDISTTMIINAGPGRPTPAFHSGLATQPTPTKPTHLDAESDCIIL